MEEQIAKLNKELDEVQALLKKEPAEWTQVEKNCYGDHNQLRTQISQLVASRLLLLAEKERSLPGHSSKRRRTIGSKRHRTILRDIGVVSDFALESPVIRIPSELSIYLNSRLETGLILYKRKSLTKQLIFLEVEVIKNGATAWILGAPGTGKSVTAFSFAWDIARKGWLSSFIYSENNKYLIIQFQPDGKVLFGSLDSAGDLETILSNPAGEDHIVFLDGYRHDIATAVSFYDVLIAWCCPNFLLKPVTQVGKRRLVMVSSMASRGKTNVKDDLRNKVEELMIESWSEEDFVAACSYTPLLAAVETNLDACSSEASLEERVGAKFYFAGGSARFMFEIKTRRVRNIISEAVQQCDDINKYLVCLAGDRYSDVVNRLLGFHIDAGTGVRYNFIVSEYGALLLSQRAGPGGVKAIALTMKRFMNPCITGWLFEMLFFANVSSTGLRLTSQGENTALYWPKGVMIKDIDHPASPDFFAEGETWGRPRRWNQIGYDVVHFDPEKKRIEIFQITHALRHDFRIEAFASFLKHLPNKRLYDLVIYFVIPLKNSGEFVINKVTGEGTLTDFDGWEHGKERSRAKIGLMEGFD